MKEKAEGMQIEEFEALDLALADASVVFLNPLSHERLTENREELRTQGDYPHVESISFVG